MGDISRVYDFEDGQVLTEAQLDAEFNQIVSTINNLDNDNVSPTANIAPSKISSTIKGDAIARDAGTGALSAKVDASTLEISGDAMRIKDLGVTTAKLAADAVTNAKLADDAVEAANIADDAVTTAAILDAAVTVAKLAAPNLQISSTASAFTTTSTSFQTVTNLTVSITSTGRPIYIGFIPTTTAGYWQINSTLIGGQDTISMPVRLQRDAVTVASWELTLSTNDDSEYLRLPPSGLFFIEQPSAGTYTYTVDIRCGGSTMRADATQLKIFALEM